MSPSLDSCIASIFEPGNPGSATDSGAITKPHYSGFFLLEESIDHFELDAEDEVTEWFLTGDDVISTFAGTWSGIIKADVGQEGPPGTITFVERAAGSITTNGTHLAATGVRWMRYVMTGYVSGTCLIYVAGVDFAQYILVEEGGAAIGRLKLE
jgi:hypothetical protein